MKIEQRRFGRSNTVTGSQGSPDDQHKHCRNDLRRLLQSDSADEPVCAPDCPAAGPALCSRHCPDLARMMSSDPETPLESGIAPLAYELKRLAAFQPCWSCEGHNDSSGDLWKKPSVWFYCDSVVHLRVLANSLKELHLGKHLNTPWRVALTFSDPHNPDTTFALEPNLDTADSNDRLGLEDLQRDAAAIAEHLRSTAFNEARKLMAQAV